MLGEFIAIMGICIFWARGYQSMEGYLNMGTEQKERDEGSWYRRSRSSTESQSREGERRPSRDETG